MGRFDRGLAKIRNTPPPEPPPLTLDELAAMDAEAGVPT